MASMFESMNPFAAGSPISALTGEYGLLSNPTEAWDKFKNGDTNEINKEIAEQNLAFQRENLDYNRALNERIFERADTAHQREVQDMRAAGLNPIMSMGGAETGGSATPTEALHNEYQHKDMGLLSAWQSIGDLLNTVQNYEIGFSKARESRAQADSAAAQSKVDMQTAIDKIVNSHLDKYAKMGLTRDLLDESEYNKYFGINKGMTDEERMARILSKAINPDEKGKNHYVKYDKNGNLKFGFNSNSTEQYQNMAKTLLTKQAGKLLSEIIPF